MKDSPLFVGIDVSKRRLDVAVRPTGDVWQTTNDARGITTLVEHLVELVLPRKECWKPPAALSWLWRWRERQQACP